MLVERGLMSFTGTTEVIEVSLTTPVTKSQAFIISSQRSPYNSSTGAKYSDVKMELTTEVDDKWTKIKGTRADSFAGREAYVEWQVISGSDFTVQYGNKYISGASATQAITAVNLSKAFIVVSREGPLGYPADSYIRARFTSSTQIELQRGTTINYVNVYYFVIEWEGATVQSDLVTVSGDIATDSISTVTLSQSFLQFNYYTDALFQYGMPRGRFSAVDEVEFKRGYTTNTVYVSYFVVSHPDIFVQSGLLVMGNGVTNNTATLGTAVDISMAFAATPTNGNGYLYAWAGNIASNNIRHTHKLWQDGPNSKVTIRRGLTSGAVAANWQVVELYEAPEPEGGASQWAIVM